MDETPREAFVLVDLQNTDFGMHVQAQSVEPYLLKCTVLLAYVLWHAEYK